MFRQCVFRLKIRGGFIMRRWVFALAAVAALGVTLPASAQYVVLDPGPPVWVPIPVYPAWWGAPFPVAYPYWGYRSFVANRFSGGY
jgi:hypothetical protein